MPKSKPVCPSCGSKKVSVLEVANGRGFEVFCGSVGIMDNGHRFRFLGCGWSRIVRRSQVISMATD